VDAIKNLMRLLSYWIDGIWHDSCKHSSSASLDLADLMGKGAEIVNDLRDEAVSPWNAACFPCSALNYSSRTTGADTVS